MRQPSPREIGPFARVLAAVVSSGAIGAAIVAGCGDGGPGEPAGGDGGVASSSGASSSGTPESSSGASSSGVSSSGVVRAPDDPQPGLVACGTTSCQVDAGFACCATPEGSSCLPAGGRCDAGIRQLCDEGTDCDNVNPTSCCLGLYGTGTVARCSASGCAGRNPQLCRSSSECDGGVCAFATCAFGITLRVCDGRC